MKKTNKENPITTFRKLNEARKGTIMKSLKKAQDGIGVNDTMNDDMINKAGSTGGYKTSAPVWSSQDRANTAETLSELARPVDMLGTNAERMNNINRGDYSNGAAKEARNDALSNYQRQVAMYNQQKIQDSNRKKGGTHKMPNGKVMLNSKMKTGGSTKAAKFAALAPPYNKATAADRIAGAKKNKKK